MNQKLKNWLPLLVASVISTSLYALWVQEPAPTPRTIVVTSEVTPAIQLVPIVVTAVPEVTIPGDLWRCIQNPSLALSSPDYGLDYNNYQVIDLTIKGRLNVYLVYNVIRNEARPVTTEWGVDADGLAVLVRCEVPQEWSNYEQLPTATPYTLPAERSGTPAS